MSSTRRRRSVCLSLFCLPALFHPPHRTSQPRLASFLPFRGGVYGGVYGASYSFSGATNILKSLIFRICATRYFLLFFGRYSTGMRPHRRRKDADFQSIAFEIFGNNTWCKRCRWHGRTSSASLSSQRLAVDEARPTLRRSASELLQKLLLPPSRAARAAPRTNLSPHFSRTLFLLFSKFCAGSLGTVESSSPRVASRALATRAPD